MAALLADESAAEIRRRGCVRQPISLASGTLRKTAHSSHVSMGVMLAREGGASGTLTLMRSPLLSGSWHVRSRQKSAQVNPASYTVRTLRAPARRDADQDGGAESRSAGNTATFTERDGPILDALARWQPQ